MRGSTPSSVPISWSVFITHSFAPPCRGPLSAPIAPTTAEWRSGGGVRRIRRWGGIGDLVADAGPLGREGTGRGGLPAEPGQLLAVRQLALQQEVADLLVGRVRGQVGDVVAAVHEDPLLAVDRA